MNNTNIRNIAMRKCLKELKSIGLNIEGNKPLIFKINNNKSCFGVCRYHKNDITIEISEWLFTHNKSEDASNSVTNTIMHELIHATGIHNHGSEFKKIANIVNKKFGYSIERTGKVEFNDNDFKYILQCKNCGNKIRRHKKSKVIQHPEYFTCGSCRGKLERIK